MRFEELSLPTLTKLFRKLNALAIKIYFFHHRKQLKSCSPYYSSLFTVLTAGADGGTDWH